VTAPATWHYGLVAKWWAEFAEDGPEIAYFQKYVERGQPALDVPCGTGRLLIPYLRAGLDVDGCDVSADMIAVCRERAEREGLSPTLFVQPMHELDPPRRYKTIFVCGGFGLGSNRERDAQALQRFYEHLEPGGTLVLDNEVPYSHAGRWSWWAEQPELPRPWSSEPDRGTASDGSELALWSRTLNVDPLDQSLRLEIRAEKSMNGVVVAREEHELTMRMWFRDELVMAMRHAGFRSVDVSPGVEERILVYVAQS